MTARHYINAYTPERFGAVGDGVTNDSAAVQAAADAARAAGHPLTLLPNQIYRASITWKQGYDFRGVALDANAEPSSVIRGLPGVPTLTWDPNQVVYGSSLSNIKLIADEASCIYKIGQNQPAKLLIDRCRLSAYKATNSTALACGMHLYGGFSNTRIKDTDITADDHGILCDSPTSYGGVGFEWWTVENGVISGRKNAIRMLAGHGGCGTWMLAATQFKGGEHTIVLGGSAWGWIWDRCVAAEAQGGGDWATSTTWTGAATASQGASTATITSGDATKLSVGDLLTIQRGKNDGAPYEGTILGRSGNVVTLDTAFQQAVSTPAKCTNARWDIVHVPTEQSWPGYGFNIGRPSSHLVLNTGFGRGSGSITRYAFGGPAGCGENHTFQNFITWGAPVFDLYRTSSAIGSGDVEFWGSTVRPAVGTFAPGAYRWDPVALRPNWADGLGNWRDASGAIVT